MDNFYEILGVEQDASMTTIKSAFKKLAKELHPDVGGDEEMFKKINEANETLTDADKRQRYDNTIKTSGKFFSLVILSV